MRALDLVSVALSLLRGAAVHLWPEMLAAYGASV